MINRIGSEMTETLKIQEGICICADKHTVRYKKKDEE